MDKHPDTTGNYESALRYAEMGFRCIPLVPGTKRPCVKWKPYQTREPTPEEYHAWFADTRNNIALVCGELIVVDVDSPYMVDFVLENCGKSPAMSRTPRGGFHLHYRARKGVPVSNRVKVKGMDIDLRVAGGYSVEAGSVNEEGTPYVWLRELLPLNELPVFKVTWTRERVRRVMSPAENFAKLDEMVRRARAYVATIEGAISGQRGHDRTMRVAGVLCQRFGLSLEQALPIFREWNEQCEPMWSEAELLHKLRDAIRLRGQYGRGQQ